MDEFYIYCVYQTHKLYTLCAFLERTQRLLFKLKKLYPHSVSKCISYIRISAGSDISSYDMNFLSHKLRFTGEVFERTVCGGYVNECLRFTVHN